MSVSCFPLKSALCYCEACDELCLIVGDREILELQTSCMLMNRS